jgi:hypothetical protein
VAKAKVLHKRLKVDDAGKSHKCQHNSNHSIRRGDKRLKVTEGRTDEHYCLDCAAKFLSGSIASLQCLLDEVNAAMQGQASSIGSPSGISGDIDLDGF